jgi:hypothetical protein
MAGKHRANKEAEQQQQAYYEGQQSMAPPPPPPPPAYAPPEAPPAAPPAAGGLTPENMSKLRELGQLREQGILTDEEFASQKALILGT